MRVTRMVVFGVSAGGGVTGPFEVTAAEAAAQLEQLARQGCHAFAQITAAEPDAAPDAAATAPPAGDVSTATAG